MRILMKHFFQIPALAIIEFSLLIGVGLSSCSDSKTEQSYDPNRPVEVTGFSPTKGYAATKVLIQGANFGTDLSKIEVKFNEKKAVVVGSSGVELYVLTPKLPGENCVISVNVDGKMAKAEQTYNYISAFSLGTLCGFKGNSDNFIEGTLAQTEFNNSLAFLAFDKDDNLFVTQGGNRDGQHCVAMINENENISKTIFTTTNDIGTPQVPTVDPNTQIIYAPTGNYEQYYEIDPATMWNARMRSFTHPTPEQIAGGMKDFSIRWKHAFAYCKVDGYMYTRDYFGDLIKIDLVTRVAQKAGDTLKETDAYLYFDPNNPEILYITYTNMHCIYTYNVLTNEHKLFAGFRGAADYIDGPALEARFRNPRQLVIDAEGNLFVADCNNHCIRQVSPDGMVTTVVGIGGTAGYADGSPEDALLDQPWGLAINSEGTIYVADRGNRCIRKLAIQ